MRRISVDTVATCKCGSQMYVGKSKSSDVTTLWICPTCGYEENAYTYDEACRLTRHFSKRGDELLEKNTVLEERLDRMRQEFVGVSDGLQAACETVRCLTEQRDDLSFLYDRTCRQRDEARTKLALIKNLCQDPEQENVNGMAVMVLYPSDVEEIIDDEIEPIRVTLNAYPGAYDVVRDDGGEDVPSGKYLIMKAKP